MKVIIIYSGKGGVGKTTTTANIAKTLIEQNQKVFILDADVNTPSMPVIFENPHPHELLMVDSLGYKSKSTIYITDSSIRAYISDAIDSINKFKPDYVLIDTPPSITDVHINLVKKIKPSGMIVVTQPNALSITDINRTSLFFKEKGVNIIGVVENMCTDSSERSYPYRVLESIPFEAGFSNENAFLNNKEKYASIVNYIKNSEVVILENQKRQLFDETITVEDIDTLPFDGRGDLKFINVATWDYVRELLIDSESYMVSHDRALSELTTDRISRLIKAFEKDEEAYFMVTKAPLTEIRLIAGEIGQASLTTHSKVYGVPCIKYHTSQGEVTLFPYEVMPVPYNEVLKYIEEGHIPTPDGRYLPNKATVEECYNTFRHRIGLSENWEEIYDQIMTGKLPKINAGTVHDHLSETKPGKERKVRRRKTIGDFHTDLHFKLR